MNYEKLTQTQIIGILEDTLEYSKNQRKEIERLNNIINELEKWLWEQRYEHNGEFVLSGREAKEVYTMILDKIKELKENK